MATFEDIMKKAPSYLTSKFDSDVSDAFAEYIEEEEIEEIDVVKTDVGTNASASSIVEFVGDKFEWNDSQKQSFFSALRILFGLEKVLSLPSDIEWTSFTEDDLKETREYINKQCFNAFTAMDQSFITIETIGRNHQINIVPLLFDVYSFYKYKNIKANQLTHSQFCSKSQVLGQLTKKEITKKIYQSLVQTLASFEYRMIPKFNVNSYIKIDDNINIYIKYTLQVSNMLNNVISNNKQCLPLLVDFWIIPPKVRESLKSVADEDDSEDESDESDSDEDDTKADTMTLNFAENLKKYKANFTENTVNCDESAKCSRTLRTAFDKILKQSRRSIKICIILDRRKSENNLLIYQLPLKYSAIPRNYCNETLIYSSSEHLMYDIDNSILKQSRKKQSENKESEKEPIFGAKFDCDGKMFCLSFALHETNKNRIQFWRHGGGIRFWPNYMQTVWPKLFVNPKIEKMYAEKDYIANNFGLNVKDELFDAWYESVVDFDHE